MTYLDTADTSKDAPKRGIRSMLSASGRGLMRTLSTNNMTTYAADNHPADVDHSESTCGEFSVSSFQCGDSIAGDDNSIALDDVDSASVSSKGSVSRRSFRSMVGSILGRSKSKKEGDADASMQLDELMASGFEPLLGNDSEESEEDVFEKLDDDRRQKSSLNTMSTAGSSSSISHNSQQSFGSSQGPVEVPLAAGVSKSDRKDRPKRRPNRSPNRTRSPHRTRSPRRNRSPHRTRSPRRSRSPKDRGESRRTTRRSKDGEHRSGARRHRRREGGKRSGKEHSLPRSRSTGLNDESSGDRPPACIQLEIPPEMLQKPGTISRTEEPQPITEPQKEPYQRRNSDGLPTTITLSTSDEKEEPRQGRRRSALGSHRLRRQGSTARLKRVSSNNHIADEFEVREEPLKDSPGKTTGIDGSNHNGEKEHSSRRRRTGIDGSNHNGEKEHSSRRRRTGLDGSNHNGEKEHSSRRRRTALDGSNHNGEKEHSSRRRRTALDDRLSRQSSSSRLKRQSSSSRLRRVGSASGINRSRPRTSRDKSSRSLVSSGNGSLQNLLNDSMRDLQSIDDRSKRTTRTVDDRSGRLTSDGRRRGRRRRRTKEDPEDASEYTDTDCDDSTLGDSKCSQFELSTTSFVFDPLDLLEVEETEPELQLPSPKAPTKSTRRSSIL